jgi:integrase
MAKLTKRLVDSLRPNQSDAFYWDSEVRGFGMRLKPSGHRSFCIQYRTAKGRTSKRFTIGPYGTYTVEKARERARHLLQAVREGRDPLHEREADARAPTVAELGARYLEEHARPKKKPSSIEADERNLNNHILPVLRQRPVAEVTRADIMRLRHQMQAAPGACNRTLALLSKMFNLAELWGLRPDGSNPCRHVERYPEKKLERFLVNEELKRLADALAEAERTQSISRPAIAAIRLLLFTGCRVGEILSLQWDHVDEAGQRLRLPDSKTGAKVVHLSAPALLVLSRIERKDGNPYVIAGRGDGPLGNLRRPWVSIRKVAGIEDARIHDLRHSFASVGVAGGLSLPIVGKLLGHSQPVTTARYSHLADDPLKQAVDLIGRRIEDAMRGGSANVVPLGAGERVRRG